MTKERKEQVVQELTELMQGAGSLYAIDFTGLNVAHTNQLRRSFKDAGIRYRVAKNTLVKRALQEVGGYDNVIDRFTGQSGIAVGYDDPAAPARVLKKFLDDNKLEIPSLKFASLEGAVFEGDKLKDIASMPSRPEIIAAILGSINAPISGIVGSINAVMRDLASVIEEVGKKQAGASA